MPISRGKKKIIKKLTKSEHHTEVFDALNSFNSPAKTIDVVDRDGKPCFCGTVMVTVTKSITATA